MNDKSTKKLIIQSRIKNLLIILLQTFFLSSITLLAVFPVSCRITPEGIELLGAEYHCPVLEDFYVVSEQELCLDFSDSVKISGLSVTRLNEPLSTQTEKNTLSESIRTVSGIDSDIATEIVYSQNNQHIQIFFDRALETGEKYSLYGQIEDRRGSTLTFALKFTGYNNRIPKIIFTEVHTKYAKAQTAANGTFYRHETIDLLVLDEGNTSGLEIISGADGESKKYVFPSLEVKQGDQITVHLRNCSDEYVSETGNDITLCKGFASSNLFRDLVSENQSARLGDQTDVIILRDTINNNCLDVIMYSDTEDNIWPKDFMISLLEEAKNSGLIDSTEKSNAILGFKITDTKSLIRTSLPENVDSLTDFDYPVPFEAEHWTVDKSSKEKK